jgi:putative transposase
MYLTETHIIKGAEELNLITFKCKNLYNKANYIIRQEFINNGKYHSLYDMFTLLVNDHYYTAMPARVSRKVLTILDQNWKSFFSCIKSWSKNKEKFTGRPQLPKYLPKNGKFNACFNDNAILRPTKKNPDTIGLSSLNLRISTKKTNIKEVNIKPLKTGKYKINITYKHDEPPLKSNNNKYCSIDLGLNNLMTLTSNESGINPVLVNGRPLKSINQYYNKLKAKYQSKLPKNIYTTKRINKLTEKRNSKINHYLHESSKWLINYCVSNYLNTIIIGYNEGWKQEIKLGKRNNQNFVGIPYQRLIDMIWYKATLEGINVKYQEEAYTSKCSSIDLEVIKRHENYKGQRICRGLFKTSTNKLINADVNGSLNILRKAIPNINFINGIEAAAALPKRIKSFKD